MTAEPVAAHVVYHVYGARRALLYIGVTSNLGKRIWAHQETQPWWSEVARVVVAETHTERDAAVAAEGAAIRELRPRYNVKHNATGTQDRGCVGGSVHGYTRHRQFREPACSPCQVAHTEYVNARHARALARGSLTHGKPSTYTAGCRCAECREGYRLYMSNRREQRREQATA